MDVLRKEWDISGGWSVEGRPEQISFLKRTGKYAQECMAVYTWNADDWKWEDAWYGKWRTAKNSVFR